MKIPKRNVSIILASGSPRRHELLEARDIDHYIMPVDTVETLPRKMDGREAVQHLSLKKAFTAVGELEKRGIQSPSELPFRDPEAPCFILASDTVVWDGEILGKPRDRKDALDMLMSLSGNRHTVCSGAAVFSFDRSKKLLLVEETEVYFKSYTAGDLEEYLATDEPYDKAGAYAIQGYFSRYIDHIVGDRDNVIGLPTDAVIDALNRLM